VALWTWIVLLLEKMPHTGSCGIKRVIKISISIHLDYPHQLNSHLNGDVFYPTEQIQKRDQVFCGHLCLHVLKQLQKGKEHQEIISSFW